MPKTWEAEITDSDEEEERFNMDNNDSDEEEDEITNSEDEEEEKIVNAEESEDDESEEEKVNNQSENKIEENKGFSISYLIENDDDLIEQEEEEYEREREKKKRKREAEKQQQDQQPKLPAINLLETIKPGKPKYVKPFDYNVLREQEAKKGVIFVSAKYARGHVPHFMKTEGGMKRTFGDFGTITRLEAKYERKNNFKQLVGYYIEFEDKNIAKRVAASLNGNQITRHDSRMYNIQYLPHFDWNETGGEDAIKQMKIKFLKAQYNNELKAIKEFKNNKKWSEKVKENKAPAPVKNMRFDQKRLRYQDNDTAHIEMLKIFNNENK
ncbi:hypothetical protein ABK040_006787 [Willaertia magna]